MRAAAFQPALVQAHLVSVGLEPGSELTLSLRCIMRYPGSARSEMRTCGCGLSMSVACSLAAALGGEAIGRRRRRQQNSPLIERLQRSRRIKPWISADQHDDLLKLGGGELRRDLVHAAVVEQ